MLNSEWQKMIREKKLERIVEESDGAEIIIPACNHHDFLFRYLEEKQFINEPHNIYVASKILPHVIDGRDPVEVGISLFYDIPNNVRFLSRHEDYKTVGWQIGVHGDKGSNGGRASINSRESAYGKSITGHSHTPEILRNTFVVGTSTKLRLGYNTGPCSWMNTNGLLYETGKVQLVNIVDGEWKK